MRCPSVFTVNALYTRFLFNFLYKSHACKLKHLNKLIKSKCAFEKMLGIKFITDIRLMVHSWWILHEFSYLVTNPILLNLHLLCICSCKAKQLSFCVCLCKLTSSWTNNLNPLPCLIIPVFPDSSL